MSSLQSSTPQSGYVKVTLAKNQQVRCQVITGNTYMFYECVNCGDRTETSLALMCEHYLCEGCYATCTTYACKQDDVITKKDQVSRRLAHWNESSDTLCLKCPKCFNIFGDCRKTAEHIINKHPEIFEEKQSERCLGILDRPTPKEVCHASSDERRRTTCSSGGEKHELPRPHRHQEANSPAGKVFAECHSTGDINPEAEAQPGQRTSAPASRGERSEDHCAWSKKMTGDVQELKEKVESATRPAHVNEGLRHVYLECPACSEVMAYFAMKVHIFNEHADIRVDAKQPQCRINQEHFKNGPPRPVECQMHGEQVIPMDYDEHVNVRSKQRLQNGALFPRVEGSERRKKIEKEVELLKDIIKKLQERIERLQTPLVTHRQPQLSFQAHLSPSKVPASTNLRTSKQLQPSENFCRL
ncbi:uncharacterized protein LOC144104320 isoform X2 [Amblyomma americanum]